MRLLFGPAPGPNCTKLRRKHQKREHRKLIGQGRLRDLIAFKVYPFTPGENHKATFYPFTPATGGRSSCDCPLGRPRDLIAFKVYPFTPGENQKARFYPFTPATGGRSSCDCSLGRLLDLIAFKVYPFTPGENPTVSRGYPLPFPLISIRFLWFLVVLVVLVVFGCFSSFSLFYMFLVRLPWGIPYHVFLVSIKHPTVPRGYPLPFPLISNRFCWFLVVCGGFGGCWLFFVVLVVFGNASLGHPLPFSFGFHQIPNGSPRVPLTISFDFQQILVVFCSFGGGGCF